MVLSSAPASAQSQEASDKPAAGKDGMKVTWNGAPELSSADGQYTMKVRGRLFLDMATGDQNEAVTGNADLNATERRAARLGVEGVLAGHIRYVLEADYSGDIVELGTATVAYVGLPFDIEVGTLKPPNSLEEKTSSRYTTFMERAAITDAFAFARQIGVDIGLERSIWSLEGGIFRGGVGTGHTDEGLTLAARATVAPYIGDMGRLHLGAHVRYRERGAGEGLFGYSQRPHQHLAAKTLSLPGFGDSDTLVGVEAAVIMGPFSLQSEYMRLHVINADPTAPNADFDGYYVSASWFLTGESRNYTGKSFGRVSVHRPVTKGGPGAWQLAVRFDTVDLTDGPFMGGRQDSYIFGVNWYLSSHLRLMANYNKSRVHGGANDGADINLFGLRSQVDW